ncbi:MAG: hypothetical protein ACREXS_17365 [Gammaproteobacteria bacterium]
MADRDDYLIFRLLDVDLSRSPLRRSLDAPTLVLGGDHYIVASGEADLACRITHIPKARFA